jgi:hypothetical protein
MVVSFAIGLGWNRLWKGDDWKYILGALIAHPKTRGYIWKAARWAAPIAWAGTKIVAADAVIIARAAATTQTGAAIGSGAMVVAAVGAGYTIGAVSGTIIVSEAEKREIVYEGATADVLEFYTGEGQYWAQGADDPTPGYFNIPGNASLIAKHYWNKWV